MCATNISWKDIQNTMVVTFREGMRTSFSLYHSVPVLTGTTRVQHLQMVLSGRNKWFLALLAYWEALKNKQTKNGIWPNPNR